MKLVLLVISLFSSSHLFAGKVETPSSLKGATIVNASKVKELQSQGAVVVDTRKGLEFAEAHVKGAIHVPYKEKSAKVADFDMKKDKWKAKKLPKDKNTKLVLYCNGKTCWKSFKSSKTAVSMGYKNVYWFRGGMPEWKKAGLPTE